MQRPFHVLLLTCLLAILCRSEATAQIVPKDLILTDFKIIRPVPFVVSNSDYSRYTYATFEVTIKSPISTPLAGGDFGIYPVNSQTKDPSSLTSIYSERLETIGMTKVRNVTFDADHETAVWSGSFNINYFQTNQGRVTKLELLYDLVPPQSRFYSNLVDITFGPTPPPPSGVDRTKPPVFTNDMLRVQLGSNQRRLYIITNNTINLSLWNITGVTINGITAPNLSVGTIRADQLDFEVPAGITLPLDTDTGPVIVQTSVGNCLPLTFPRFPHPYGYTVIGPNRQYVSSGSSALIKGRVAAASGYADYSRYRALVGTGEYDFPGFSIREPFAQSSEQERFVWQYSFTNSTYDWTNIMDSSGQGRDYTEKSSNRIIYFRRNSYHGDGASYWYTSNTAMVVPQVLVSSGVYKIRNRRSGQVLNVDNSSVINQRPSQGTANQQWNIQRTEGRKYRITSVSTGQVLEIGGNNPAPITQGTVANLWSYSGGANQQWSFSSADYPQTQYFAITNANSWQVLEIGGGNAANIQPGARANQWPYYGSGTQHHEQEWELVPVTTPSSTLFPGVWTLTNVYSLKLLEIPNSSTTGGEFAQQRQLTGIANQHWTITETGGGFFKIINRSSGLALEIGGNTPMIDGTKANQWPYWGGANQQWAITETSPGSRQYKIINRNSGQALEIGGDNTAKMQTGATANQWPYVSGASQHWIFTQFSQNKTAASPIAATGEQAAITPQLSLYPNPASTILNLVLSGGNDVLSIKISDLRGAAISTVRYQGNGKVDISSLAAGAYIVTASDGKREYHQKFIKE